MIGKLESKLETQRFRQKTEGLADMRHVGKRILLHAAGSID